MSHLEDDLERIAQAQRNLILSKRVLVSTVVIARNHGRSWGQIARVFGVSKQAIRGRFKDAEGD